MSITTILVIKIYVLFALLPNCKTFSKEFQKKGIKNLLGCILEVLQELFEDFQGNIEHMMKYVMLMIPGLDHGTRLLHLEPKMSSFSLINRLR